MQSPTENIARAAERTCQQAQASIPKQKAGHAVVTLRRPLF
jgi:hypothetical protein